MSGEGRIRRLAGDPPSPWEEAFGYSRVVVAGGWALVSGTTSVGPGGAVIGETPAEQAAECLRRALGELSRVGVSPEAVVAVRFFVTDISRGDEVGRALQEVLGAVRPVATMVEVQALIDPRMMVELEVTALAPG